MENPEEVGSYNIDPHRIGIADFFSLLEDKKLLPGRLMLREYPGASLQALKQAGISSMGQLLKVLASGEKRRKIAGSTGLGEDYLKILNREAASYLARPFPLSEFPGIPFEYTEVLKTKGIANSRDLYEALLIPGKPELLSRETGIPEDRMRELNELCDLSRIAGVGPRYASLIHHAGIRSLREFANMASGEKIAELTEDDMQYSLHYARVILQYE